jgi:hypothetical protein
MIRSQSARIIPILTFGDLTLSLDCTNEQDLRTYDFRGTEILTT